MQSVTGPRPPRPGRRGSQCESGGDDAAGGRSHQGQRLRHALRAEHVPWRGAELLPCPAPLGYFVRHLLRVTPPEGIEIKPDDFQGF